MKLNNLYWIINTRNDKEPLNTTWPQIQTGLVIDITEFQKIIKLQNKYEINGDISNVKVMVKQDVILPIESRITRNVILQ